MKISEAITLIQKNPFNSWTELAGVGVLITVTSLGFIANPIATLSPWLTLVIVLLYGFVTWGIQVADVLWMRHLQVATLATLAVIVMLFGDNGFGAALMFFVLSATVMYKVPTKQGYWWIIVFGIIILTAYLSIWSSVGNVWAALGTFAGFLFFGSTAESQLKAEQTSRKNQQLLHELQLAHYQLQDRADQAEELAAINERNRLARDVHDTLGHQLTVAAVQLEGAQKLIHKDPNRAEEIVGTVRSQVLEGLNELRKTISTLRAPIEEDLALPIALSRLVDNFQQATDIQVELSIPKEVPDLPNSHRQALFRTVQESLTNIQKHAQADSASVNLMYPNGQGQESNTQNSSIRLMITDNGIGLPEDAQQHGFGLKGMAERANYLGGTVAAQTRPSGGTEISFAIPLSHPPEEQHLEEQHPEEHNRA